MGIGIVRDSNWLLPFKPGLHHASFIVLSILISVLVCKMHFYP